MQRQMLLGGPRATLLACGLCVALGASLAACAGQATRAQNTPTPEPTQTPSPRVLYTADWSHGADGWTLPADWRIQNGQLVNDGQGDDPLTIPFTPSEASYTVEMQAQAQGYTCPGTCNVYGLDAHGANGAHLFVAEIDSIQMSPPHHGFAVLTTPHPQDPRYEVATQDFIAGANMRAYTVSVDGETAEYSISNSRVGAVSATLPLAPAALTLIDQHVQLVISSFSITSP